ncbi:MAG: molybdopterin cofactor-binding domain-containing protein [Acidobacteriota bacterium]
MNDQHFSDIRKVQTLFERKCETKMDAIDRRAFLKLTGLAGGGLVLALHLGEISHIVGQPAGNEAAFIPNAFLRISSDGSILIYSQIPEMGQGVKTALPMIVAEELDAEWSPVRVEQAPINEEVYGRQRAVGSRSIPTSWNQLRQAGAVARTMLVAAAAQEWGVSPKACVTKKSTVIHSPSGRRLSYAELANRAAALPVPDPESVKMKKRSDYRLLGKRISGVDNHKIVTGQPLFGIDKVVPGMLYTTYEKCPATGGRVAQANLKEIRSLPGVKDAFVLEGHGEVTELMPGVAIVATSTWAAFDAKRRLRISWDKSQASKDSWSGLVKLAWKLAKQQGKQTLREIGNVDKAFRRSAKTVEAFYIYPFVSHAPLEPQNCTAWYRNGAIEIWAPTQNPGDGFASVARTLGLRKDRVTIHTTRIGGGFGRRLKNDYLCEAAAISKRAGAPVKLQWTREDDMAHDFYRVGGFHSLKGALDDSGKVSAWQDHFVTFSSDGQHPVSGGNISEIEFPAQLIPNFRLTQTMLPLDTPCGPWRAPRSNTIAFVVQSFLHELAVVSGRDHLEFLLQVMGEPRLLGPGNDPALLEQLAESMGGTLDILDTGRAAAVIQLAANKAGWGRPLPAGRGLGLAFHFNNAGHFAEVAEVSVNDNKKLTVHKVTVAGDVGPIINRSGAENQCEGAVIDGFSTMMGLELSIEDGIVQESNFDQYPILRIDSAPKIEVHLIESDFSPTGLGEPALPPVAPAICNAIFAATGHRVRELPLTREGFSV